MITEVFRAKRIARKIKATISFDYRLSTPIFAQRKIMFLYLSLRD
jgi:hypothetical protein